MGTARYRTNDRTALCCNNGCTCIASGNVNPAMHGSPTSTITAGQCIESRTRPYKSASAWSHCAATVIAASSIAVVIASTVIGVTTIAVIVAAAVVGIVIRSIVCSFLLSSCFLRSSCGSFLFLPLLFFLRLSFCLFLCLPNGFLNLLFFCIQLLIALIQSSNVMVDQFLFSGNSIQLFFRL